MGTGQRKIRVGELLKRELSWLLHSRWKSEAAAITLTDVDVSADLRRATVYYSVLGGREAAARAAKFLMRTRGQMRLQMGRNVTLKYTPELQFAYDPSVERGMRVINLLDSLDGAPTDATSDPAVSGESEGGGSGESSAPAGGRSADSAGQEHSQIPDSAG